MVIPLDCRDVRCTNGTAKLRMDERVLNSRSDCENSLYNNEERFVGYANKSGETNHPCLPEISWKILCDDKKLQRLKDEAPSTSTSLHTLSLPTRISQKEGRKAVFMSSGDWPATGRWAGLIRACREVAVLPAVKLSSPAGHAELLGMKRCGGKMAYLGVLVLLLKLHMADGNSCSGQKNGNGTLTFNVNSSKCDGYSWKINGTVVAYDQNCTKTLVQEHGPNYIIFKSFQTNVSYFCDRNTINCTELIQNITDGAGILPVIIVIAVVAGVIITGVIVFIIVKWKK
ncbi:hypothetical protein MHYP_G00031860 [Metynnis hypsauchen]